MVLVLASTCLFAQSAETKVRQPVKAVERPEQVKAVENPEPARTVEGSTTAYKLTFSIFEIENGKRVNQRDYSLVIAAGRSSAGLRVGSRIPIETTPNQFNYTSVGLDLRTWVEPVGQNKLLAQINVDLNTVATEPNDSPKRTPPIVRNLSQDLHTILTVGKPQLVASIDDIGSTAHFQLEVTATKVE